MDAPSAGLTAPDIAHQDMANAIRALAMDAVEQAKSGHPGMPMGMADVATVLFTRFLKHDPAHPEWPDRDRFVLSAGHGSMLLYALLYLTGYPDIDIEQIRNFRQLGSCTAGHPEYGLAAGIETTTGPLGQGLGNSVGMALAERICAARFGDGLIDHYTYVLASDGDLMEGISHEAMGLAGHLGLGKLIVLYDSNAISIDGPTSLSYSDDAAERAAAHGWEASEVDGQDPGAVAQAIEAAQKTAKPSLIICRTTIGFGAPAKAGTAASHGAPLGEEEVAGARKALGWPHEAFVVPPDILAAWRAAGARCAETHKAWQSRAAGLKGDQKKALERLQTGALPKGWERALIDHKAKVSAEQPSWATRVASQKALTVLVDTIPELVGGSADLTPSNGTMVDGMGLIAPGDFAGRYIHYGVREHGMAAAMNGMSLHGGVIPYGGTFLVFTDYCRPSLRLAALMQQRVIYIMTHDSIGLGEDGPTHQPIEHLASLRAMPNVQVFRPADAVETAECWQLALSQADGPSVLALSRQGLPTLRTAHHDENLCARGGYVLQEADGGEPRAVLLATGSEVALAYEARALLQEDGVPTRVVSLPCWELFDAQDQAYRDTLLGRDAARVAVEAASPFGWERYVGRKGAIVAMHSFGASAPAKALFQRFGFTAEAVAAAARACLPEQRTRSKKS